MRDASNTNNHSLPRLHAAEAARRVLDYGFQTLGIQKVEALIRPINTPSIRLAERLGMCRGACLVHHGYEHYVYTLTRPPGNGIVSA